ncbi:MAG: sulfatase-like hydrolase/transferase, partial [Kocuria sp.]|nr:sulfatase-like hydrolase/transferase [Kocuria sp.]
MTRPDIVLILADDLGYSDLGCYGGEIDTPRLDALAAEGVRLTQFYNTARCSPSRASLLTGMHPHQTGIGVLTGDDSPAAYQGTLQPDVPTRAEMLSTGGYRTAAVGKWHLAADVRTPNDAWPTRRGFDSFYGTLTGCGSYYAPPTLVRDETDIEEEAQEPGFYYTDAISDEAVRSVEESSDTEEPLFLYVAYTAPHWPLHAPEEDIATYTGR